MRLVFHVLNHLPLIHQKSLQEVLMLKRTSATAIKATIIMVMGKGGAEDGKEEHIEIARAQKGKTLYPAIHR